jgi:hypothetical protein
LIHLHYFATPGSRQPPIQGTDHRGDGGDQDFLDSHCLDYNQATMLEGIPPGNSYKDYILGNGPDGIAKTPA